MLIGKYRSQSDDTSTSGERANTVESVHRAIKILVCLSQGINNLTDIANECRLSNSTVHRLLRALGESGAVVEDPVSRRYYPGHLIARLASSPQVTHELLIRCADREMNLLSTYTEETVSLITLVGLKLLRLFCLPSKHPLRVVEIAEEERKIGDIYLGAPAKVLLSQYPEDKLKKTLRYIRLDTENNPEARIKEISVQVKRVREQGYAVTSGENVKGGMCVSVPIRNYVLPVSLNIYGPRDRLKPRIKEYLELALESAARISANIKKVT